MKRAYSDIVGDYYGRQNRISDLSREDDLRIYDQGKWVSLYEFFKKRSQ